MTRQEILKEIWHTQDDAYTLMVEYDELPHHYGDYILYQAEGELIQIIGSHPGVTVTDLGNILKKTPSACCQIVRKLREKGFVEQTRNRGNNRFYNLTLTEEGQRVYESHRAFNQYCQNITFRMLDEFSQEELETHLRVQQRINEAYRDDVERCRDRFAK